MTTYRDLLAWQQGIDLVDEIYAAVAKFPKFETYGLAGQMRESSVSVPCNIAEGHGRYSFRDFRRCLREARGSAYELETQIIIASRQRYITNEEAELLIERVTSVTRLISGLIRHLNRRLKPLRTTNHERRTPRSSP